MEWAATFMKLEAPVVLFTTEELAPIFTALRESRPLHIITLPFEELDVWKLYKDIFQYHHTMDPERKIHSPELYAVWTQKAWFVERAIEANPFQTDFFFWCDIGAFRNPAVPESVLKRFPQSRLLPADRILMSSVDRLTEDDSSSEAFRLQNRDRIVGGLWGGGKAGCLRWKAAFQEMFELYIHQEKFAGKDQHVMLSAYLRDPTLATIVTQTRRDHDPWFFMEYLLSENAEFKEDPSYVRPHPQKPIVSVSIMGGLGNQMFQIAAAYAYARQQGGQLQVERIKRSMDTRPTMYWDSVLQSWNPYLVDRVPDTLPVWYEKASTKYTPIPPLSSAGLYINAYAQSSKYFGDPTIREEIRQKMRIPNSILTEVQVKYKHLLDVKDRLVVVHARRTDYLASPYIIQFHGPLTPEYYKVATEKMLETVQDPIFLLCSDDTKFWAECIPVVPAFQTHSVYILNSETDVNTMGLLQQCSQFILANSSFSWWCAWLSDAPNKRVIVPSKWFGPTGVKDYEDIYEPEWERV